MRLAFYAPFKPQGHPNPSGDLTIATGLLDFLRQRGHVMDSVSRLRTRWIYWRPWRWPAAVMERHRALQAARDLSAEAWLTYHAYYKAPDVLGPWCARRLNIPYVVFQGIFSTKRRRDPRTWPGYVLNRSSLLAAAHVFTNKREDLVNLRRLLPETRLSYVRPGIRPEEFVFDPLARRELRTAWGVGETPVILSAAMFRPGVKVEGLRFLMDSLAGLDTDFHLIIAGDGRERAGLEQLAERLLPGRVRFLGLVPRGEMRRVYSGADLFAFPGIRESLGMVYLEAQSCGLPVVAFDGWGVPEVVEHSVTGLLSRPFDRDDLRSMISRLLRDSDLRSAMGLAAAGRVRREHDQDINYGVVERVLRRVIEEWANRTDRADREVRRKGS